MDFHRESPSRGREMGKSLSGLVFTAVLLCFAVAQSATAATLSFTFSFQNPWDPIPGDIYNFGELRTVTGIVRGLSDNATGPASSVEVLSNAHPTGFGVGEYIGNPLSNSFTVLNGQITAAAFSSLGARNSAPAVTTTSLGLSDSDFSGLVPDPNNAFLNFNAITWTPVSHNGLPVAPIPLPASLFLLLGGMGGLGLLARRRVRAAV